MQSGVQGGGGLSRPWVSSGQRHAFAEPLAPMNGVGRLADYADLVFISLVVALTFSRKDRALLPHPPCQ
jgi:hypothetical protein